MNLSKNVSITFRLNNSKKNSKGLIPIWCRIKIDGRRAEFSTSHQVLLEHWDAEESRVSKRCPFARKINETLEGTNFELRKLYHVLLSSKEVVTPEDLNAELPDPHFEQKEIWDKLSLYEIADRDSAKFEEARESDPYFDLVSFKTQHYQEPKDQESKGKLIDSFKTKDRLAADPVEDKVNRKLEELYKEINRASVSTDNADKQESVNPLVSMPEFSQDVDRLEQMMEVIGHSEDDDADMQQIEGVLEKILDIQHPERVKERLQSQNHDNTQNTFGVEVVHTQDNISELMPAGIALTTDSANEVTSMTTSTNAFFGLEDEMIEQQEVGNALEAVIHGTQELVVGATVRLRLLNEVRINNNVIKKDQFIYGICAINGERLTIEVNSIRSENLLLPVSLAVYDLDGLEGIYIPGAITRDAAKQASDDALQNVQLMSLDPSIGQQAAGAGIEAAKGLLSKKAKLIKVTVKAGYQVLLKDNNQSNQ